MAHAVLRIRSLRTVQVGKLSLHDTSLFKYITLSAELPTYALLRVGVRVLIASLVYLAEIAPVTRPLGDGCWQRQ